jgi:hypothetical protein
MKMRKMLALALVVALLTVMLPLVRAVGWKTYTNGKFGFSIKHPADWEVLEERSDIVFQGAELLGESNERRRVCRHSGK